MASIIITFFILFSFVISCIEASVPAVYVFGDSTADVGNNNFLPQTSAKANFSPYGIDFVHRRATGRFSNGLVTADFLAKKLGFQRSPAPFLSIRSVKVALPGGGVNFASAASGIHDDTGSSFGDRISLWKQIQGFGAVRDTFVEYMGAPKTNDLFKKSIFFVSVGSNDLIDFFSDNGPVAQDQKNAFIQNLVSKYKLQLRTLYENGARKFVIVAPPPVGCCPSQRAFNTTGGCLEDMNELSRLFYDATYVMLRQMSFELSGFKYSLGNLYEMVTDFFQNAHFLGFTELELPCCGNGTLPCSPNATVCFDRRQYLFWDSFHPTMQACKIAAETLFNGPKKFVSPVNIAQLASDDY